jgi:hypothetical protein
MKQWLIERGPDAGMVGVQKMSWWWIHRWLMLEVEVESSRPYTLLLWVRRRHCRQVKL